ncbi:UNVERIFIED_CONTAM: hypothetical protein GTU68_056404 [Idotea baltica]|nr:hypothetical protein [Idotea baltica]
MVNDVAPILSFCLGALLLKFMRKLEEFNACWIGNYQPRNGISLHFVTLNKLTPFESIGLELEEGPFKKLNGLWYFDSLGDQACKMSLDLTFEYSGPLVKLAIGPLFETMSTTLVDAFCQRAKQLYG